LLLVIKRSRVGFLLSCFPSAHLSVCITAVHGFSMEFGGLRHCNFILEGLETTAEYICINPDKFKDSVFVSRRSLSTLEFSKSCLSTLKCREKPLQPLFFWYNHFIHEISHYLLMCLGHTPNLQLQQFTVIFAGM